MSENDILHETTHFWICKKNDKLQINLKVIGKSYVVGEKFGLDNAKGFVAKMERYPENIKHLLPKELQFEAEQFQKLKK